jgi:hypothetical protein
MLGGELIATLQPQIDSGRVLLDMNFDTCFAQIEKSFPFAGSKIDWAQLKDSIELKVDDINSGQEIKEKLKKVLHNFYKSPEAMVTVVGDSAMDFALKMTIECLFENIESILELPQHIYILAENANWCVCISMEGYVSFGVKGN